MRLQREANAAGRQATAEEYSAEVWRPWLTAAAAAQRAVAEYASEKNLDRVDLEMAVKKAAREADA
ncbi:hypothetical protein ACFQ60_03525 [Streptomyces zhihengii]